MVVCAGKGIYNHHVMRNSSTYPSTKRVATPYHTSVHSVKLVGCGWAEWDFALEDQHIPRHILAPVAVDPVLEEQHSDQPSVGTEITVRHDVLQGGGIRTRYAGSCVG